MSLKLQRITTADAEDTKGRIMGNAEGLTPSAFL